MQWIGWRLEVALSCNLCQCAVHVGAVLCLHKQLPDPALIWLPGFPRSSCLLWACWSAPALWRLITTLPLYGFLCHHLSDNLPQCLKYVYNFSCHLKRLIRISVWSPQFLCTLKVDYHIHKSPQLNQFNSAPALKYIPLRSVLILLSHVRLGIQSCNFPAGFPTQFYMHFIPPIRATVLVLPSYSPWFYRTKSWFLKLGVATLPGGWRRLALKRIAKYRELFKICLYPSTVSAGQ
jgi:hypothetical protein